MVVAKLISLKQAAVEIGESGPFVRALISNGEIVAHDRRRPGSKVPRWKIDPEELKRWAASRRVCVAPGDPPGTLTKAPARSPTAGLLAQRRAARRSRQEA